MENAVKKPENLGAAYVGLVLLVGISVAFVALYEVYLSRNIYENSCTISRLKKELRTLQTQKVNLIHQLQAQKIKAIKQEVEQLIKSDD